MKFLQVGGGNGYPIYSMSGQVDNEWHMAQITVDSEYSSNPFNVSVFVFASGFFFFVFFNFRFTFSLKAKSASVRQ